MPKEKQNSPCMHEQSKCVNEKLAQRRLAAPLFQQCMHLKGHLARNLQEPVLHREYCKIWSSWWSVACKSVWLSVQLQYTPFIKHGTTVPPTKIWFSKSLKSNWWRFDQGQLQRCRGMTCYMVPQDNFEISGWAIAFQVLRPPFKCVFCCCCCWKLRMSYPATEAFLVNTPCSFSLSTTSYRKQRFPEQVVYSRSNAKIGCTVPLCLPPESLLLMKTANMNSHVWNLCSVKPLTVLVSCSSCLAWDNFQ